MIAEVVGHHDAKGRLIDADVRRQSVGLQPHVSSARFDDGASQPCPLCGIKTCYPRAGAFRRQRLNRLSAKKPEAVYDDGNQKADEERCNQRELDRDRSLSRSTPSDLSHRHALQHA